LLFSYSNDSVQCSLLFSVSLNVEPSIVISWLTFLILVSKYLCAVLFYFYVLGIIDKMHSLINDKIYKTK
jgi:hypothetical protein